MNKVKMMHPRLKGRFVMVSPDKVEAHRKQGWRPEGQQPGVPDAGVQDTLPTAPGGNASAEEWRAYAVQMGVPEADVDEMSRDDVKSLFA